MSVSVVLRTFCLGRNGRFAVDNLNIVTEYINLLFNYYSEVAKGLCERIGGFALTEKKTPSLIMEHKVKSIAKKTMVNWKENI